MNLKIRIEKNEKGYKEVKNARIKLGDIEYDTPISFATGVKAPFDAKVDKNGDTWIIVKDFDFVAGGDGMKLKIKDYEVGYNKESKLSPVILYLGKDGYGNYSIKRELYNPTKKAGEEAKNRWIQVGFDGVEPPTDNFVKATIKSAYIGGYLKKDGSFVPKLIIKDFDSEVVDTTKETTKVTTEVAPQVETEPSPIDDDMFNLEDI